jgi:hypothetical protein
MCYENEIKRSIELLQLCLDLQCEKDGIERKLGGIGDDFSMSITKASSLLSSLYKLIPLADDLSTLGRHFEQQGYINVDISNDYSRLALDYLLESNGLESKQ